MTAQSSTAVKPLVMVRSPSRAALQNFVEGAGRQVVGEKPQAESRIPRGLSGPVVSLSCLDCPNP